ncbi:MAG: putative cysteine desulfurase 2 [Methanoregula sp. PtaU1.Bin051]|nr:MAG: putative cysteine desulfurase 2 [Methanoregula sp. PtaU1.Bin051]
MKPTQTINGFILNTFSFLVNSLIVSLMSFSVPSVCVMREPPVKKILYWCEQCNIPLLGKNCACGAVGRNIPLLQPYDVRPALAADMGMIRNLVTERFGNIPVPKILLLNKTGGLDRADLVIANGYRFGWLTFDPVDRKHRFDLAPESLPFIIGHAERGIIDLEATVGPDATRGRIGGKKFAIGSPQQDGIVIVRLRNKYGTGSVSAGFIRVKEIGIVEQKTVPDPGWDIAVRQNRFHLKNLERNAIRSIRHHMEDRPTVNVSFSGGKDSTAVLNLARKAGVNDAFFIDTGLEFPETVEFVKAQGIEIVLPVADFWQAVVKAGPPGKDHRWCCKLLKLRPLKLYLARIGPCVTIQGNRWYESWNRAGLDETSQNPDNPLQLNVSPIRNWRALEVFLYLWWQKIPINPLYDMGIERIGCYLCPAMLESEYEQLRKLHPAYTERWDSFLESWAESRGIPDVYCRWGLWRWKALPKKMRELCSTKGIELNEDFSVKATVGTRRAGNCVRKDDASMKTAADRHQETYAVETIRKDFPIVSDLVYMDNAATSFSPEPVVQAVVEFEHHYRANVGRGVHRLTRIASQRYWHAHEKLAQFVNGSGGITVFTKNTTESINMVAGGIAWKPGDRIVTTILEHHSNLLPWLSLVKKGVEVDIIGIHEDYTPDLTALEKALGKGTRLVAITHASNVVGVVTPVKEIAKICHEHGAKILIDAAQTVPHLPVDLGAIGCDFAAFSGHKMCGPTGTGVLWMKEPILEPSIVGGGMVETVSKTGFVPAEGYQKYEAGTPNIAGGIGLGVAADYLNTIGMKKIHAHEQRLTAKLIDTLKSIDRVHVYAPESADKRIGVVSFTIDGIHPHEVAQYLDENADIMVRSGHHCCQPLMEYLGLPDGTVRASLALYSTEDEVDLMVAAVEDIVKAR